MVKLIFVASLSIGSSFATTKPRQFKLPFFPTVRPPFTEPPSVSSLNSDADQTPLTAHVRGWIREFDVDAYRLPRGRIFL
jgi:hypothetical protein